LEGKPCEHLPRKPLEYILALAAANDMPAASLERLEVEGLLPWRQRMTHHQGQLALTLVRDQSEAWGTVAMLAAIPFGFIGDACCWPVLAGSLFGDAASENIKRE
jgi:hypothetical protein